jgi:hypothetical protein
VLQMMQHLCHAPTLLVGLGPSQKFHHLSKG